MKIKSLTFEPILYGIQQGQLALVLRLGNEAEVHYLDIKDTVFKVSKEQNCTNFRIIGNKENYEQAESRELYGLMDVLLANNIFVSVEIPGDLYIEVPCKTNGVNVKTPWILIHLDKDMKTWTQMSCHEIVVTHTVSNQEEPELKQIHLGLPKFIIPLSGKLQTTVDWMIKAQNKYALQMTKKVPFSVDLLEEGN